MKKRSSIWMAGKGHFVTEKYYDGDKLVFIRRRFIKRKSTQKESSKWPSQSVHEKK